MRRRHEAALGRAAAVAACGLLACARVLGIDPAEVRPRADASDLTDAEGAADRSELPDVVEADAGDASANDGDGDAGQSPPLLENPSFEDPGTPCGPGWVVTRGTAGRTSLARTGSFGCMVCVGPGGGEGSLERATFVASPAAGTYTLGAYARQLEDGGSVAASATLTARFADAGPGTKAATGTPSDLFEPLSVALDVGPGATSLEIELDVAGDAGQCAVFDDVSLLTP